MTLNYTITGIVKISLYKYIESFTEFPSDMNWSAKTPAATHLFNVEKEARNCSRICANFSPRYLSRYTIQDIQMAVAFLCTRVQRLNEDDHQKLTRVLQYIWNTREPQTIEPDKYLNWWVDSSYAVHPDMHSNSGIVMTRGKCVLHLMSCKTETKHKKFNRGRTRLYRQCHGTNAADQTLPSISRYVCTNNENLPR